MKWSTAISNDLGLYEYIHISISIYLYLSIYLSIYLYIYVCIIYMLPYDLPVKTDVRGRCKQCSTSNLKTDCLPIMLCTLNNQ